MELAHGALQRRRLLQLLQGLTSGVAFHRQTPATNPRIQKHREGDSGGHSLWHPHAQRILMQLPTPAHGCPFRNHSKDPMFFYDEIFAVEPLSGRIWAKSKVAITFTFTPKVPLGAGDMSSIVYHGHRDNMFSGPT